MATLSVIERTIYGILMKRRASKIKDSGSLYALGPGGSYLRPELDIPYFPVLSFSIDLAFYFPILVPLHRPAPRSHATTLPTPPPRWTTAPHTCDNTDNTPTPRPRPRPAMPRDYTYTLPQVWVHRRTINGF